MSWLQSHACANGRKLLFVAGLLARVVLVAWAAYQDAHFAVRYTDVDYLVFSDAAEFVSRGISPYARATYRYTPFIAYLLVPNVWLGSRLFGKALFIVCDLIVAWLLWQCCILLGYKHAGSRVAAGFLLNPLVINISTRGNSETLTILLLVASLYGLLRGSRGFFVGSAVCLGLAAHVRLFPVLNGVPIALYILAQGQGMRNVVLYGLISILSLTSASMAAYWFSGMDYLRLAVFYHATRVDHRHSLSPAYPLLYLDPSSGPLFIIPQLFLTFLTTFVAFFTSSSSLTNAQRLCKAIALQTAVMVASSRVLTVQYFAWWIPFVSLMPFDSRTTFQSLKSILLWISALMIWLSVGFALEFAGEPWAINALQWCGSLFFVAQMNLIGNLL